MSQHDPRDPRCDPRGMPEGQPAEDPPIKSVFLSRSGESEAQSIPRVPCIPCIPQSINGI